MEGLLWNIVLDIYNEDYYYAMRRSMYAKMLFNFNIFLNWLIGKVSLCKTKNYHLTAYSFETVLDKANIWIK
jgi:hypothetical protein